MKKLFISFSLLFFIFLISCSDSTLKSSNCGSSYFYLEKGEKYLGFSVGYDDHTLWVSTENSSGTVYIRRVWLSMEPFTNNIIIKNKR